MMSILTIVAPVFGLIAIGYLAGKTGYLSEAAGKGIADFAFSLSIPAILFRTILLADFGHVAPLGILASFFGSAAVVWLLSALATRFILRRPMVDAPSIAMCSVFGNTIMLGLPIGVASFGPDAATPLSVILAVHAPIFLLTATVHAAIADGTSAGVARAAQDTAHALAKQPIIVAIASAGLLRLLGVHLPAAAISLIDMLAQAGVPTALVALGISLRKFELKGDVPTLAVVMTLKLLVLPALAAAMAYSILTLPDLSAKMVVLTAALPAGANAYLFAMRRGRGLNSASGAVALGTVISSVTITILLVIQRGG